MLNDTTKLQPAPAPEKSIPDSIEWARVKAAMAADPSFGALLEGYAEELEKTAGNTPVLMWLCAAIYEFVARNNDVDKQDSLMNMLADNAGQDYKLTH